MRKVKIFASNSPSTLEDEINKFALEHNIIQISYNENRCMVLYEEKENP